MNPAYDPSRWSTFFSAQAGASAALVGLLFVAVSINLAKIIKMSQLVTRSAKALYALMSVLIASTMCMVPAQPVRCLGGELLFLGALVWVASTWSQHASVHKNKYVTTRGRVMQGILTQLSAVPFILAGASILAGFGGGLYWLVPATIFSFIAGLFDAWVLLIEFQR